VIGSALISTPWSIRNCSRPGSTNAGSVVANVEPVRGGWRSTRAAAPGSFGSPLIACAASGGGHVTGFTKRPVSDSARLKIDLTLPFLTCSLNSVYGIVNGASGLGSNALATQ
jgi:hypothetical protein